MAEQPKLKKGDQVEFIGRSWTVEEIRIGVVHSTFEVNIHLKCADPIPPDSVPTYIWMYANQVRVINALWSTDPELPSRFTLEEPSRFTLKE